MRIVTVNVNGIRSAERKGFARWLARIEPWDVVCLQEIKAHVDDVPRALAAPRKSHASFHTAAKRGYSGVALYAKRPASVQVGFGSVEFDAEGRYVEADFGHLSIISVYLPSGSSSPERQIAKFRFLAEFLPHLLRLRDAGREVILCGDWNIAHQPIDLQRPAGLIHVRHAQVGQDKEIRRRRDPVVQLFGAQGNPCEPATGFEGWTRRA